jgi:hypothetical protein
MTGGGQGQYDDDDEVREMSGAGGKRRAEFDCPSCTANNPTEEPPQDRDEIICNYCGAEFRVSVVDGRVKLREM